MNSRHLCEFQDIWGQVGEKEKINRPATKIPDIDSSVWIFLSIIFTGKLANTLKWIFKRMLKDVFKFKASF